MKALRWSSGFTLIELIMVIVILSVLSTGSVRFISQSTQGVIDTAKRQRLASVGMVAIEKIAREIREALPNSVRVSGSCIEFVPVQWGSQYITLPVLAADDTFNAVAIYDDVDIAQYIAGSNYRVAVYPMSVPNVYAGSNPGPISVAMAASNSVAVIADPDDNILVTLSSNFQFSGDSPEKRFYVVSNPVTYCAAAGYLYRYNGYGFDAVMGASRPTTFPGREVVADKITNGTFSYSAASLVRNAVVEIALTFQDAVSLETQTVDHEVQLRNVP